MLGRTHLVIGLFVSLLVLKIIDINQVWFVVIVLFASILPDIDESHSLIGKKFPLVGWFSKHRGFFHSIYTAIIFSLIVLVLSNLVYALAFFLGYFLHLLLDSTTKSGITFFVLDKRVRGSFRTGGFLDNIIFFIFLVLSIILIVL